MSNSYTCGTYESYSSRPRDTPKLRSGPCSRAPTRAECMCAPGVPLPCYCPSDCHPGTWAKDIGPSIGGTLDQITLDPLLSPLGSLCGRARRQCRSRGVCCRRHRSRRWNALGQSGQWSLGEVRFQWQIPWAVRFTSRAPPPPRCGDGVCNGSETCASCPSDCGPCCRAGYGHQWGDGCWPSRTPCP